MDSVLITPAGYPGTACFYEGDLYCAVQQVRTWQLELYQFHVRPSATKGYELVFVARHDYPLQEGSLAFPILWSDGLDLWIAYRSGDFGVVRVLGGSQPTSLGKVGGNWPIALGYGFVAWQAYLAPFTISRVPLAGGQPTIVGPGVPPGLSRILPDGRVRTKDDDRTVVPYGLVPGFAGPLTVAEALQGGVVGTLVGAPGWISIWPESDTQDPQAAWDGKTLFATTTWGQNGVRLALFTTADLQPNPPVARVTVPSVAPFDRSLWLGDFFGYSTKYGDAPDFPRNCTVIVDGDKDAARRALAGGLPIVASLDVVAAVPVKQLIATYVAAEADGTIASLERAVADAQQAVPSRPVIGYWPLKLQAVRPSNVEWLGVECYQYPDETVAQCERRLTELIAALPMSQAIVLIVDWYDRAGQVSAADLETLQPIWPRLARDQRVKGVLGFAVRRPSGAIDHPFIADFTRAFLRAIPSVPAITEIKPAVQTPPAPPELHVIAQKAFADGFAQINDFYASADGLQRPGGMVITRDGVQTCDIEAMQQWGYQLAAGASVDSILRQIRQSDEWKTKHPGETPNPS